MRGLPQRSEWTGRDILIICGPALLITIAGFIVAIQFVKPAPPKHIVMATGPEEGAYYRFGLLYQQILARDGIELEIRATRGTDENTLLLEQPDGEVGVAFLQGGVGHKEHIAGVQSIGSVFHEPIWVFWRGDPPDTALALAGKRVAAGRPGSGTHAAITEIIELNGISYDDIALDEIGGVEAAQALIGGRVDAAGFVATYDTRYVQDLLAAPGIRPMPFVRADAYMRRYRFLSRVILPRGAASLENDIPPADVPLIAMVANIGIRDTLHPALIGLLLRAAQEVHGEGGLFEAPGEFPTTHHVVLPINRDARRYLEKGPPLLQRFLPFWLAVVIDRLVVLLIPFVTLLYPLFKILPPTYRWRIRSRIFRHYRALLKVEQRLREDPSPAEIERCRASLAAIEQELSGVSVPLSYSDMLYRLRLHLQFVKERLLEVEGESAGSASTGDADG
jgi:hypothetical protein